MKRAALVVTCLVLAAIGAVSGVAWWRDRRFTADHPPPGRFYGAPGAELHGIERPGARPDGPAVILVHGNPGTCLDFAAVIDALPGDVRAVAIDRPGHGWSGRPRADLSPMDQARLIHDAVAARGIRRPALVGFSFGGPVVVAYALAYPDEVRALVLVAAVADPVEGHRMSTTQARLVDPISGPILAHVLGPTIAASAVATGFAEAFAPLPTDAAVVARGQVHFARPSTLLATARDWGALEPVLPSIAARYGDLRLPVEALGAERDRVVGPAHVSYLAAHVPGIAVTRIDGAGHQLLSTHPRAVADAVVRALGRSAR